MQLRNPKGDPSELPKLFTYDTTYGPDTLQRTIFDTTGAPIVGECPDVSRLPPPPPPAPSLRRCCRRRHRRACGKPFAFPACDARADNVMEGYNGTIFAYGQTGAGNSYRVLASSASARCRRGPSRCAFRLLLLVLCVWLYCDVAVPRMCILGDVWAPLCRARGQASRTQWKGRTPILA